MKHFFHRLLIIVCALHLSGSHWMMLQVTAWTGMLVNFAQQDSLSVAAAKTFDGEHPCELCHAVKKGMHEEQEKQVITAIAKLEAVLAPVVEIPHPAETPCFFFQVASEPRELSYSPPVPVPIAA